MATGTQSQPTSQKMRQMGSQGNPTTIINTHQLKKILLADGWHDVQDAEIVPYSVGSSPQSDYQTGLQFSTPSGEEYVVRLSAIQAFSVQSNS